MKETVMLIILISIFSNGCITDTGDTGYDDVHVCYPVRDVYRGYEDGSSIIIVEYYDDNFIKTVDNQYMFGGRKNYISVQRSENDTSYLYWYASNKITVYQHGSQRYYYPQNKYILYLANSEKCEGINTHTPHSNRPDYESFIYNVE